MSRHPVIFLLVTIMAATLNGDRAAGCPFCTTVSQTFSQEIASADVVAIVRLVKAAPPHNLEEISQSGFDTTRSVPKATFEMQQVLKGAELWGDRQEVKAVYFGDAEVGTIFMMTALGAPALDWTTPLRITERVREYLGQVAGLTSQGAERLEFFLDYLEDAEDMLARDAYDEFARASYEEVKLLHDKMDREQLIAWINDINRPPSRRRLYLTMLGVCGEASDAGMLEEMIRSDDRKTKAALDATIGCYLTLIGEEGLPLVEELLLKNQDAEYTDTYAAIMALRFHADQGDPISPSRAVQALRHMLERPELADLVVPDLAKWEDWDSMPRLIQLFKDSTDENSWVRVPVVNYLRRCPLPEAEVAIAELEQIDPEAVRRARTFFPTTPLPSAAATPELAENKVGTVDDAAQLAIAAPGNELQNSTANDVPESGGDKVEIETAQIETTVPESAVAQPDGYPATSDSVVLATDAKPDSIKDEPNVSWSVWTLGLSLVGLFAVVYAIKLTLA